MISFDIFNTLITRTVLTPHGIFAMIQQKLSVEEKYWKIPEHIRENFYTLRIQAENLARHSNQCKGFGEVTLHDIYTAMAMRGNLSIEVQKQLYELEYETECENVLPVPQNIALLKEMLQHGEHVVLISDMYLPGEVIRKMLVKADEILGQVPLYVSADLGVRKTTGNLYRKVGELEQVTYDDWTHYGDDLFQDIQMAGELGIKAIHLPTERPVCLEQKLLERFKDSAAFQLLVGQARYTRYVNNKKNVADMKSTAYEMGCSVCGPILYSYVDWVLQEAVRKGIKRLYFIARDGYFPKLVADKVIAAKKLDIETYYIYGSRKAWRFCSLSREKFNLRELVLWSYVGRINTIRKLAELLELEVQELIPFLPFGSRQGEVELTPRSLYEIVVRLEEDEDFREFYLKKQLPKRTLAMEYIKQHVDCSDDSFAFVDVSGGGLTQGCLHSLMKGYYERPITTFFFKLDRVNLVQDCIYDVFFPSMLENNLVIEMICRAPNGQTLGYEQADGEIVPVFDNFENQSLMEHGFEELERGIGGFADNMLQATGGRSLSGGVISVIEAYLDYVAHHPDEKVLEYFASFPNNESGREKSIVEYAPKLTKEDIENIFLGRMWWEDTSLYYKGTNLEYSLLRCNESERKLADWCRQNYDSEQGKALRLERQQQEDARMEKYKRAAHYPCELLEENIILYGAGKLGTDLYLRLQEHGGCRIVKWVDKNPHGEHPAEVETVESIMDAEYDQVVIAVMNQQMAEEIKAELMEKGVSEKKIFWSPVHGWRNPWVDWNKLVYGE